MIITIGGPPGSGKTTVGRLLALKLEYEFISTGMIFREMAKEKGLGLTEFSELAKNDHDIDKELDKRVVGMAKGNLVLEGRLAAYMLHLNGIRAFKIWVDAHAHTRAQRIAGREKKDPEVVMKENREREECEHERYKKIYDIDSRSLAVYDMVVHSDDVTPEEVVTQIVERLEHDNGK